MDDLKQIEDLLRQLPPRQPSDQLRERIFGPAVPVRRRPWLLRRPVGLGWALAASFIAAVVGFSAAHFGPFTGSAPVSAEYAAQTPTSPDPSQVKPVGTEQGGDAPNHVTIELRIADQPNQRQSFDLTGSTGDFLSGDVQLRVEKTKEIGI